jgi:hypothetical protein
MIAVTSFISLSFVTILRKEIRFPPCHALKFSPGHSVQRILFPQVLKR